MQAVRSIIQLTVCTFDFLSCFIPCALAGLRPETASGECGVQMYIRHMLTSLHVSQCSVVQIIKTLNILHPFNINGARVFYWYRYKCT